MYRFTYSIIAAALLLAGCSNEGQTQHKTSEAVQKEASKQQAPVETVVGKKPEAKKEQTVAIETHGAKEEADMAKTAASAVEKKQAEAVAKVEAKVTQETTKAVKTASVTEAASLYKSCAGCHGTKGEKKALGKSEKIGGWSAAKVEEALKGYKAKTRNVHGMGAVMQGQAAKLSDEEIKALAEYIEKLK